MMIEPENIFRNHLRQLGEKILPPQKVLDGLGHLLKEEMMARDIWYCSPSFLGYYDDWAFRWQNQTVFQKLTLDCYEFAILKRYRTLIAHASLNHDEVRSIQRNVKHFLIEKQRDNDPIGYAVYCNVKGAVQKGVAEQKLFLRSSEILKNETLIRFQENIDPLHKLTQPLDSHLHSILDSSLLQEMSGISDKAQAHLLSTILDFPETGILFFSFGSLVSAMLSELRKRRPAESVSKDRAEIDLQQEINTTIDRYNILQQLLEQKEVQSPSSGDLYMYPGPEASAIQWIVIMTHPDEAKLSYLVPVDENPLVGMMDIPLSGDARCGPLSLRCSLGVWVHQVDLKRAHLVGFLDPEYVQLARRTIADALSNTLNINTQQLTVDDDPEYEEWMNFVESAATELRHRTHETRLVSFCFSSWPEIITPVAPETQAPQWLQNTLKIVNAGLPDQDLPQELRNINVTRHLKEDWIIFLQLSNAPEIKGVHLNNIALEPVNPERTEWVLNLQKIMKIHQYKDLPAVVDFLKTGCEIMFTETAVRLLVR
ncbi:hypothetical protein ACFL27_00290 [candidate division CSSED10-310 bacterium]|uniref:Uncharacterized protein n=1 Tax=candidate division CSSED10-310 bacterium TaxID=2855610 RepID=A0ABV6YQY8_UNCC1